MFSLDWARGYMWMTLIILVALIIVARYSLLALVKTHVLDRRYASTLIKVAAGTIGVMSASFLFWIVLALLWPTASNYLLNTTIPKIGIWQREFQLWLTPMVKDPTAATALGLVFRTLDFGQQFISNMASVFTALFVGYLMGRSHHETDKPIWHRWADDIAKSIGWKDKA